MQPRPDQFIKHNFLKLRGGTWSCFLPVDQSKLNPIVNIRAEHILRMRVVTANGTIVDLSPGHATLHPKYQHEPVTQLSVHR